MNPVDLTESGLLVDLENGRTSTQDNTCGDIILNTKHKKDLPARICGDRLDLNNLPGKKDGSSPSSSVLSTGETSDESVEIDLDKLVKDPGEKRSVKEKRKMTSKKPPRPPTAPSLDAADVRFAREISEFYILKRKRLEHLKGVKKSKADKTSSSLSSILAMFITVIFFLVLIFQGLLGSRV